MADKIESVVEVENNTKEKVVAVTEVENNIKEDVAAEDESNISTEESEKKSETDLNVAAVQDEDNKKN